MDLGSGYKYVQNAASVDEQRGLLSHLEGVGEWTPIKFRQRIGRRLVINFGRQYSGDALPFPDWLDEFRARGASLAGIPKEQINLVIANKFLPGVGMAWHVEHSCFSDVLFTLSLGCEGCIKLRSLDRTKVFTQVVEPGSLYVLCGSARWDFEHRVMPQKNGTRISLTFRTLVEKL